MHWKVCKTVAHGASYFNTFLNIKGTVSCEYPPYFNWLQILLLASISLCLKSESFPSAFIDDVNIKRLQNCTQNVENDNNLKYFKIVT